MCQEDFPPNEMWEERHSGNARLGLQSETYFMPKEYVIFEDSVHAQVFLVQAEDEEAAWKLYLERERNYVEQPDGTYRSGPFNFESLDSIFGAYGIISHGDGSYSDTDDRTFQSWEDVKEFYGIEEQPDGTFIVCDKIYSNLREALRQTVGHHHIEIDPCNINYLAPFQTLFVSRDKWDYVELDTPKDLKADIIRQHLWQSERYKTLGQLQDAVAELKKALRLPVARKKKVDVLLDLARLLRLLGQHSAAAEQYKEVLRLATEHDNRGEIRSLLAETYDDMGQSAKALWHYKRTLRDNLRDDDLRDEDVEAIKKRIAALEQANPTTAPA